ncbi:MAG: hypothetical protein JW839_01465 [Candidatus Lokiarchaeota archaeon]|nr:hypothetical protein [Candidatus Lokiarchaeota archaeon]
MSTKPTQKRSLRKQILMTYALFSIIALGSIAAVAGAFIGIVGNTASSRNTAILTAQVQSSMQTKAHDAAEAVQSQLLDASRDLESLASYVEQLWATPKSEFGYRPSYYHEDFLEAGDGRCFLNGTIIPENKTYPENVPPGAAYNARYGITVSFDWAHWLVFRSAYVAMGNNTANMNASFQDALERSAFLDFPFGQMIKAKPQYTWIYMEFANGLDRCMPWSGTDTMIYPPAPQADGDLRTYAFYTEAVARGAWNGGAGAVYWDSPYNDPGLQGWMITLSKAVYNGTHIPANLIGVMCMDITANTLAQTVGNIRLYNQGYGFLIDPNVEDPDPTVTSVVVSHPQYINATEGANITAFEPISSATYNRMKSGVTGFEEYTKDGAKWYIAYERVPVSGYVMGVVVPQSDVLAPVRALESQVALNLTIQLVVMLGLLGVILVFALWIGLTTANSVVQPIQKLTNMALRLSTEDIKKTAATGDIGAAIDRELGDKGDEIGEIGSLTRAFKGLVKAVQEEGRKEAKEGKEA